MTMEKTVPIGRRRGDFDSFTGLLNKVSSLSYAHRMIEQAGVEQVTLCMIDLDKFKEINDAYGHLFGDSVILKVSDILKEAVEGYGIAARFGGDEFFLVLNRHLTERELREMLRSIRTKLAMAFATTTENLIITCSIGVSQYPKNGTDFDTLFRKADRGLYIAKIKGRNRYIIYKEELHGELPVDDWIMTNMDMSIRATLNTDFILRGMADVVAELIRGREDSLVKVLEQVRLLYRFDYVAIYSGAGFQRTVCSGRMANPQPDLACAHTDEVLELFDENGFYHVNMEQPYNGYTEVFHGQLQAHGISETMQCLIGTKAHLRGVLSLENEKKEDSTSQLPSDESLHLLVIFARVLGEIIL